jgi:4-hydroxy-tetrahydrodipicolinate synthase
MSVLDLTGLVTAVVTPFREDESIDHDALGEYVEYVLSFDRVKGILASGYSGEGPGMSRSETLDVARTVIAAADGRVPVLVGVSPTSTTETIDFGRRLREAGASALQINSPFYSILRRGFLYEDDVAVKFFDDLAEGIGLPMTVFQYPTASGLTYPPEVIDRLSENPLVIGFKEAVGMETYEADFQAIAGRKKIYADNNTYTLISMLLYGSDGSMVGVGNVGLPHWVELNRLVEEGDNAGVVAFANEKIVPIINTFSRDLGQTRFSFIARVKEALVQLGRIPNGTVRRPEPPVSDADRREIRQTLERVGLL